MVFIAISQAAFDAISATLALGSVSYENKTNEEGERLTLACAERRRPPQGHARTGRVVQRRDPADRRGDAGRR